MLQEGQVIGGYIVEAPIGSGAMGEVFRVRQESSGHIYALKYLPLPSAKVRERLRREAQVQATLDHPNVVTLVEVVDVHGDPGMIMEFIDGPDLKAWMESTDYDRAEAERVHAFLLSDPVQAFFAARIWPEDKRVFTHAVLRQLAIPGLAPT